MTCTNRGYGSSSTACSAASPLAPERFVDMALDLAGPLSVRPATRQALIDHVTPGGELRFDARRGEVLPDQRVSELLQLIVATREYQLELSEERTLWQIKPSTAKRQSWSCCN